MLTVIHVYNTNSSHVKTNMKVKGPYDGDQLDISQIS